MEVTMKRLVFLSITLLALVPANDYALSMPSSWQAVKDACTLEACTDGLQRTGHAIAHGATSVKDVIVGTVSERPYTCLTAVLAVVTGCIGKKWYDVRKRRNQLKGDVALAQLLADEELAKQIQDAWNQTPQAPVIVEYPRANTTGDAAFVQRLLEQEEQEQARRRIEQEERDRMLALELATH